MSYADPRSGVYRFLMNGATKHANGNYAGNATIFRFTAQHQSTLERLIIHLQDGNGMRAERYGALGAALTNGYRVVVLDENDVELLDLCDGVPIKSNGGMGRYCYDVDLKPWGVGEEFIQVRWTFAKSGEPVHLKPGHSLAVELSDDLSGLTEHYFMVQGKYTKDDSGRSFSF